AHGVVTASAGNMGQGVAWAARELGVPCTVVVPEGAAETKVAAIERLGGTVVKVPYEEWWEAIATSSTPAAQGRFVHPVEEEAVMAGNGTIGIEILEDLPDPDAVLVPFGGGGLSVGIAAAVRALAGAFAVPVDDVAAAVRLLVNRARIVAEGAGALALAAALAGRGGTGKVVCVVSGGNIDEAKLRTILSGATP